MIIGKVTTQNSGVRINLNMFWMQMEYNWLYSERLSRSRSEQNGWENAFVISSEKSNANILVWCLCFPFPFPLPFPFHLFAAEVELGGRGKPFLKRYLKWTKRTIRLNKVDSILFAHRHTRPTDLIESKWVLQACKRWATIDWKVKPLIFFSLSR